MTEQDMALYSPSLRVSNYTRYRSSALYYLVLARLKRVYENTLKEMNYFKSSIPLSNNSKVARVIFS